MNDNKELHDIYWGAVVRRMEHERQQLGKPYTHAWTVVDIVLGVEWPVDD
jgi:hypothetical protein